MNQNNTITFIAYLITAILGSLVLVIAVIGLVKGWWKVFKKFSSIANKGNLFIDNILPDLLSHLCETNRAPKDTLARWTKLLSSENIKASSPLKITDNGYELIKKVGLDMVFDENKEAWADQLREKISGNATKYDIETQSILLISRLFNSGEDISFAPIKNYLFENPNKLDVSSIYGLSGILLRDYIFDKHPDWVKE